MTGPGGSGAGRYPLLAGAAIAPDPWIETARLAAGQPEQITALAGSFTRGAGEAESAALLGRRGSELTAEGYTVDGAPVHQVGEAVARTDRLLGDSGENMRRAASVLGAISDELAGRAGSARAGLTALEDHLGSLEAGWADYENRFAAAMATNPVNAGELIEQRTAELMRMQGLARTAAGDTGRQVGESVTAYDQTLGRYSRELDSLGFPVPPGTDPGVSDDVVDGADGAADALLLQQVLAQAPGIGANAEIDALTADLRALDDQVRAGGRLSDEQRAYLTQFYDTLGSDALGGLADFVRRGESQVDPATDVDGNPASSIDSRVQNILAPFGNTITDLSAQTTDDAGTALRYEQQVPTAVRGLIDTPIGVTDPNTGLRFANDRFLTPGDVSGDNRGAYLLGGGVAGLNRYEGITSVLGSADRAPGAGLATDLADSAIRVRQDLNALHESGRASLAMTRGGGTDETVAAFDRIVDDTAASQALQVASRNVDASSGVLLDGDRRAAVLGLNWEDGTGAAALVNSGTSRDVAAGGGGVRQADAALAVVTDVARDRDGYLGRMSEPVKDATVQTGIRYLDAFAASPVDTSAPTDGRTDALGRPVGPSFELSQADRDQYLQFVAGTGEERASDFQAAGRLYNQVGVADALANGDPEQVTRAVQSAGRLDGAITQGNFDYVADGSADRDRQAAAAQYAATVDARATNTWLGSGQNILREGISFLPGGRLLTEGVPAAVGILSEIGKSQYGNTLWPGQAPGSELPQTLEDLRGGDSRANQLQRDLLLAQAADTAGLFEPGTAPSILTQDRDGDGAVDAPTSSSESQDLLAPAVERVLSEHGSPGAQFAYDDARDTAFTGSHGGAGTPAVSPWVGSDRLYYGSTPAPDPVFGPRTGDPRRLDDPAYDAAYPR